MPIAGNYAVWNNKGGVGKSTITFHLATRYAETFPEKDVLIIDLCPQSNSSMMLLGGGTQGENNVFKLCTEPTPRTVVGYLSNVISGGPGAKLPSTDDFVVRAGDFNKEIGKNIFLLCGDGNLEPMSPAISQAAAAPALTPTSQPWKWIHLIFRALVESFAETRKREVMVFIDTNPSFSIYTELAISAADRLIAPVNADDSSRVAANAMFILLHGQIPPHPIYGAWTFATRAKSHGIVIPQIHLVIGNRLTQFLGAAAAFGALSDATADTLYAAYQKHPNFFTPRTAKIASVQNFRDNYSLPLRDFNTAGVVSAHLGRPLSKMTEGYYKVHGQDVKVNTARVTDCEAALDAVISVL